MNRAELRKLRAAEIARHVSVKEAARITSGGRKASAAVVNRRSEVAVHEAAHIVVGEFLDFLTWSVEVGIGAAKDIEGGAWLQPLRDDPVVLLDQATKSWAGPVVTMVHHSVVDAPTSGHRGARRLLLQPTQQGRSAVRCDV